MSSFSSSRLPLECQKISSATETSYGFTIASESVLETISAIGAPEDDLAAPQAGTVFVFGGGATGGIPSPVADERVGYSASVRSGTTIVGAPGDAEFPTKDGRAIVWPAGQVLDTPGADGEGWAVAVGDGFVAVGRPSADYGGFTNVGVVDLYTIRANGQWAHATKLVTGCIAANSFGCGEQLGYSIAIDGENVFVGAPGHIHEYTPPGGGPSDYAQSGAVYWFDLSCLDLSDPQSLPDEIVPAQKLLPADFVEASFQDPCGTWRFGESVAIDGGTLVVGAPNAKSRMGQDSVLSNYAGGAYVFEQEGTRVRWADFDGSGVIDQGDLDLVLLNWGKKNAPYEMGEVNCDGEINQGDLDAVLLKWGQSLCDYLVDPSIPQ